MKRRELAVIVAVVLAVVGTVAVVAYVKNADKRAIEGQQAVTVYVAVDDVPAGTTAQSAVDDGLIATDDYPAKTVPDGALTVVDSSNADLVATSTIVAGEIVLADRFGTTATTTGSVAIPSGEMAVTIPLEDPAHVGSFLLPGAQVAIYDSFNVQDSKPGITPAGDHLTDNHAYTRATRVLLPEVTVLAVGSTTTASDNGDTNGDNANQQLVTLVTVSVTPAEAERLIHASQTGTLYFGLLGSDTTVKAGAGINDRNLFGQG